MRNIRGIVEYDGTAYYGWQTQPNVPTVQKTLEKAISRILSGKPVQVIGSSRTDKGVHAKGQSFNFKAELPYSLSDFTRRLNSILPDTIAVRSLRYVPMDWHARFNANGKLYKYTIVQEKSALRRNFSWYVRKRLDIEILNLLASIIVGKHYFGAFQKKDKRHLLCTIYKACWKKNRDNSLTFSVKGNFFLRGMIRALVGAMVSVASGKTNVNDFKKMLASGTSTDNGEKYLNYPMAPAEGLCLVKVYY